MPIKGWHHSEESRQKMRESRKGKSSGMKGRHIPEEQKMRQRLCLLGRKYPNRKLPPPFSEEHRRNISIAGLKRGPVSEEVRARMKAAQQNRPPVTEETRKKLREANLGQKNHNWGKVKPPDVRKKISDSLMGEKHFNWGKHPTEETLKKMSESSKGHINSDETREKLRIANTGKHHSEETKKKMSLQRKGKIFSIERRVKHKESALKGNKNPSWKGGITPQNQLIRQSSNTMIWRDLVFRRDGYTCQKYKTKGGYLNAHHIFNFSKYTELRFNINNGITLSRKAHKEFHLKYGNRHNTPEQMEEFLGRKLDFQKPPEYTRTVPI